MVAEIISVGTELLLGNIVNTNAQYLSEQLASLGIDAYYQTVVGDNEKRLLAAYDIAFGRADVVITTGGLGPTEDDLTKEVGAQFFGLPLILHEQVKEDLIAFFAHMNATATENNFKQAYFPEGSRILKNTNGTAPGCLIEQNGKYLFMIPGPPNEMIPMFENEIKPLLMKKTQTTFVSKTLRICGLGESYVETYLHDFFQNQSNPTLALYAKTSEVHLRITSSAPTSEEASALITPVLLQLREKLGQYIYGEDEETLESVVVQKLKEQHQTIACAESCTGGMLTAKLVNVPSVSEVLVESCVTYSNDAKMRRLGVTKETLEKYGAVSKECAEEMARGIAKTAGTDIGVSTTGIAGPDGGTPEKPVGLVYVGVYVNGQVSTQELKLSGNRQKIRDRATIMALNFLRLQIKL